MRISNLSVNPCINNNKSKLNAAGHCLGTDALNNNYSRKYNADSSQIVNSYSLENLQARYIPSFKAYRKTGKTTVIDKKTGYEVPADIKKEKIGDFVSFKLMIGRKEAGFLDMYCNSVFPEDKYVLTEPTNNIPEVRHLRSILGEDYAGIGTALIKTAIQESCNNGGLGNLWLESEKGYERTLVPYRSDENPIPFYYKMGFVSPNTDIDEFIKSCLKKTDYLKLPDSTLLLLTPESRNYWLEKLVSNPIIKFKEVPDIA